MHDRLVSRRIDALHQCFLVTPYPCFSLYILGEHVGVDYKDLLM